jgi:hypothetical protein
VRNDDGCDRCHLDHQWHGHRLDSSTKSTAGADSIDLRLPASVRPVEGEPQATSLDMAYVPEASRTYQAAERSIKSMSSHGALIRYDVGLRTGGLNADKAAALIQGVLETPQLARYASLRFELTPVGHPRPCTPTS